MNHAYSMVPPAKPLPELLMSSYHEAIGWNACRAAMLNNAPQPADNWIRCSEELPEVGEDVNVWLDYQRRQVATMRFAGLDDSGSPMWFWHNSDDRTTLTPKAWQPLPNPPAQ